MLSRCDLTFAMTLTLKWQIRKWITVINYEIKEYRARAIYICIDPN